MPYASRSELPAAVKSALPAHGQSIFRAAFNAAHAQYKGDESKAFATAWAAVRSKYKTEGGRWVAKDEIADAVRVTTGNFSDVALIDGKPERTSDGYMKAFARVARTGIQVYKGPELGRPEMGEVRVYRPEREVFAADAMRSLAHRPLTLHHPRENVRADNWRHHAVGYTGEDVVRDGDHVRVPLMLCDAATINAVHHDGIKQLSVGYSADVNWAPGVTPDGENYDAVQSGIKANHVAIVPNARGGEMLRIGDHADARTCPHCGAPNSSYQQSDNCTSCGKPLKDASGYGPTEGPGQYGPSPGTGYGPSEDPSGYEYSGNDSIGDDARPTTTCWSCDQRIPVGTMVCPYCREDQDAAKVAASGDIRNEADLQNAIKSMARGKNFSAEKVRIYKAAKRLGKVAMLPEDWNIGADNRDAVFDAAANWWDKEFSMEQRKAAAKKGHALPGGGYPINNRGDLGRAIQAFGRAKNPEATKRLIIRRARELGATKDLPEDWNVKDSRGGKTMQLVIDNQVVEVGEEAGAIIKKALADARRDARRDRAREEEDRRDAGNFPKYGTKAEEQAAGGGQEAEDANATEEEEERRGKQTGEEKYDRRDRRDARDGAIATLQKQLADARAAASAQALDARVEARAALLDVALPLLDRNYNHKGRGDNQIMRDAVMAARIPGADKMSNAEIVGAFKALTAKDAAQTPYTRMVDGMSNGIRMTDRDAFNWASNNGPRTGVMPLHDAQRMRDEAYENKVRHQNTAWQGYRGQDPYGQNTNDFGRRF